MSTYTITLRSGRQLEELTRNGDMFVSQEALTKADLNGDELSEVTIEEIPEEGESIQVEKENLVCDTVLHWDEGYLFNLREMTEAEKFAAEMDARVSFLEMMGGYDE